MISIEEACKKAVAYVRSENSNVISMARETKKRYLFTIQANGDVFSSPISVDKATGEVTTFFPPDDFQEFRSAVQIPIPEGYAEDDV